MFEHPPLRCRNVVLEEKGFIFSFRLLTGLDFYPCPDGRLWVQGVWGMTCSWGSGGARWGLLLAQADLSLISQPSSGSV